MEGRFEMHEPDDRWRGRQPRYEQLVMRGPGHFAAITRLPSGERIEVRLGGVTVKQLLDLFTFEQRPDHPR